MAIGPVNFPLFVSVNFPSNFWPPCLFAIACALRLTGLTGTDQIRSTCQFRESAVTGLTVSLIQERDRSRSRSLSVSETNRSRVDLNSDTIWS